MQISGMRGAVSVAAGSLWHSLQPGDLSSRDRRPQRDAKPTAGWSPIGKQRCPERGTAGGKGTFPQAAGRNEGSELGVSIQTQQGTPYRSIFALGEVNEIRLLPPAMLLPLVEAICQDHAALALEESALGERKHRQAVSSSLGQPVREDGGSRDHPARSLPPGVPPNCPTGCTSATAVMKDELHQRQPSQFFYLNEIRQLCSTGSYSPVQRANSDRYSLGRGLSSGFADCKISFKLDTKTAATHLVGGLLQHGIAAAVGGIKLHFGGVVLFEPGGNQAPAHVHEDPLGGVGILLNETDEHPRSEPRHGDHEHPHSLREGLCGALLKWLLPLQGRGNSLAPRSELSWGSQPLQHQIRLCSFAGMPLTSCAETGTNYNPLHILNGFPVRINLQQKAQEYFAGINNQ